MTTVAERQLFLDTETTGLNAQANRIVELALIEYRNRKPTGVCLHVYLNPESEIESGATQIHGMTWDMLREQPIFSDVADEMIAFARGAELVAHNADFDADFLDAELARAGRSERIRDICSVTDNLALARSKHPGQRLSLDALKDRYGIQTAREFHGARLDAEILAEVYLGLTSGQKGLDLANSDSDPALKTFAALLGVKDDGPTPVIRASEAELAAHRDRMATIAKKSGLSVWDGPSM